jgi:hypothetical protein
MSGFFGSSYYFYDCNTPYNNKDKHKCKKEIRCNVCNCKKHPENVIKNPDWKYCGGYFRSFFNIECFENHQQNGTCETIWKCKKCQKVLLWSNTDPNNHRFGEKKCLNCIRIVNKARLFKIMKKTSIFIILIIQINIFL